MGGNGANEADITAEDDVYGFGYGAVYKATVDADNVYLYGSDAGYNADITASGSVYVVCIVSFSVI